MRPGTRPCRHTTCRRRAGAVPAASHLAWRHALSQANHFEWCIACASQSAGTVPDNTICMARASFTRSATRSPARSTAPDAVRLDLRSGSRALNALGGGAHEILVQRLCHAGIFGICQRSHRVRRRRRVRRSLPPAAAALGCLGLGP